MTTRSVLVAALADSSAHGIARVASARPLSLKIMWTLLFFTFLTLCCLNARSLVDKLSSIYVQMSSEEDKVHFEFPDIYLCPSIIYSGSIPFSLTESEAKIVNDEVDRLSKLFDKFHCIGQEHRYFCREAHIRASEIQLSLPIHILERFLLHSQTQSLIMPPIVFHQSLLPSPHEPTLSVLIQPTNQICYLVRVPKEEYDNLNYMRSYVETSLFVDPYIKELPHNGSAIKPITVPSTNNSVHFEDWPVNFTPPSLQDLGYTLHVVPKGAYPSLMHDSKLGLASGKSYDVLVSMQDIAYSSDLQGKYCEPSHEAAMFVNPRTGGPQEFKSSRATCFFIRMSDLLVKEFNSLSPDYPKPWKHRDIPRLFNLTELDMFNISTGNLMRAKRSLFRFIDNKSPEVDDYCRRQQPCEFKEYELTSNSLKWPQPGNSLARMFVKAAKATKSPAPAFRALSKLAMKLLSGNHSSHTEVLFRESVENSMIKLRIWVKRPRSPKVTYAYSYSWVDFLADLGGLLGLYIGCSMLTVCELLELAYHLLAGVAAVKLAQRRRPEAEDGLAARSKAPDETA